MSDEDLASRLLAVWESCTVLGDNNSTFLYKLTSRELENLHEVDGCIYFALERHGGTVRGSANAEVHHWVVDPIARTRWIERTTRRRLAPPASRMNTDEVVSRMLVAIRDRTQGVIVVMADGRLRLEIDQFVPGDGPRQTVAQRRKRVRTALNDELSKIGLVVTQRWVICEVE